MGSFSTRLDIARLATIVDDAPLWFRSTFFDGVIENILWHHHLVNALNPVGSKWLYLKIVQLTRSNPEADYPARASSSELLRTLLLRCDWNIFYDAIELISEQLRLSDKENVYTTNRKAFNEFRSAANEAFSTSGIGWQIDSAGLLVRSLPEDQKNAERALSSLQSKEPSLVHFAKAKLMLNQRPCDAANVIKESVSALESVGRKAFPTASTLGEVIKEIQRAGTVPRLLLTSIEKLYAFANDEPGVRHGSDKEERVSRAEAELIYSVSLSFVSYLKAAGAI